MVCAPHKLALDSANKTMQFDGNTIDELSNLLIDLHGEAVVPAY